MVFNLPPNTSPELAAKFKEIKDKIDFQSKICKGAIYNQCGILVWEETEEDYQSRMNELFYEVK